jgi:hypothetical protein
MLCITHHSTQFCALIPGITFILCDNISVIENIGIWRQKPGFFLEISSTGCAHQCKMLLRHSRLTANQSYYKPPDCLLHMSRSTEAATEQAQLRSSDFDHFNRCCREKSLMNFGASLFKKY